MERFHVRVLEGWAHERDAPTAIAGEMGGQSVAGTSIVEDDRLLLLERLVAVDDRDRSSQIVGLEFVSQQLAHVHDDDAAHPRGHHLLRLQLGLHLVVFGHRDDRQRAVRCCDLLDPSQEWQVEGRMARDQHAPGRHGGR